MFPYTNASDGNDFRRLVLKNVKDNEFFMCAKF